MATEVVLHRVCKTTGESPYWDERSQELVFVDIVKGDVHRWNTVTKEHRFLEVGGFVSFIVACDKPDMFVIGHNQSVSSLNWNTGKVDDLHNVDGGRQTRFNDAKCDPMGRLWAGTMGLETAPAVMPPGEGSMYMVSSETEISTKAEGLDLSNGFDWTLDKSTMFFIDSGPRKVYAYDYDNHTGTIGNQRVFVDYEKLGNFPMSGIPDGCCIDAENQLWVAGWGSGKVLRFDTSTGEIIQTVEMPNAKGVTSCCFGGPSLEDLYVTSAATGVTENDIMNKQPNAGSLFKVTGLGVKGLPSRRFGEKLE